MARSAAPERPVRLRCRVRVAADSLEFIPPLFGLSLNYYFYPLASLPVPAIWIWLAWQFGLLEVLRKGDLKGALSLSPFVAIVVAILATLLILFTARNTLRLGGGRVEMTRWRLGIPRRSMRTIEEIRHVGLTTVYTEGKSHAIDGIGIFFEGGKVFKFGSYLNRREKLWIVDEILRFITEPHPEKLTSKDPERHKQPDCHEVNWESA